MTLLSNGTWYLLATNANAKEDTKMWFQPQTTYHWAYPAVLEAYSVGSACRDYPKSGQCEFQDIQVEFGHQKVDNPKWTAMIKNNQCQEHADIVSPTRVAIQFKAN